MLIPLTQLDSHPHNANVMPEPLLAKLAAHIRDTGLYPPLIVRPVGKRFQILDGHHRAQALVRLGRSHARCEIWEGVDDQRAAMLLLTLNRLRGEDDPFKRGDLMAQLALGVPTLELARLLPDELERIERLISLASRPPAPLTEPDSLPEPPRAITFFMDAESHRLLLRRLREIDPDRTRALLKALGIDPHGTTRVGACDSEPPPHGDSR